MKLLQYNTSRYRRNEIIIDDDTIVALHTGKITSIEDINSQEQLGYCPSKNEYISALLGNVGYCPEYLGGIIKSIRVQCKKNSNVKAIYKSLDNRMKSDWRLYISLYKEEELVDIILKFGEKVWSILNRYRYEIILPLIKNNVEASYNVFNEVLGTISMMRISVLINDLISKIGIPIPLYKNNKDVYSIWNSFIYRSMLLYLVKALAYNIEKLDYIKLDNKTNTVNCLIDYILAYLNKIYIEDDYVKDCYILKTDTDSKEVYKITSVLHFVYEYVCKHYGTNLDGYDMILQDIIELRLDYFRDYLISKEKNESKIEEIKRYPYKKLSELYNRKLFKY